MHIFCLYEFQQIRRKLWKSVQQQTRTNKLHLEFQIKYITPLPDRLLL